VHIYFRVVADVARTANDNCRQCAVRCSVRVLFYSSFLVSVRMLRKLIAQKNSLLLAAMEAFEVSPLSASFLPFPPYPCVTFVVLKADADKAELVDTLVRIIKFQVDFPRHLITCLTKRCGFRNKTKGSTRTVQTTAYQMYWKRWSRVII
jgi:hypothetical protein